MRVKFGGLLRNLFSTGFFYPHLTYLLTFDIIKVD